MTDLLLHRQINDIADVVKHEGSRSFCVKDIEAGKARMVFCGIEAVYLKNAVICLKAHDLHVEIIAGGIISFHKGSAIVLHAWHRHLAFYRRSTASANQSVKAA